MPTKVLVFESDAAFAGELRTELGRLGMVAQVVDDGYAGLMAAASERPDLILLSIELPRMNGFSVCNKLKKDPALKDVPLIIMSTDSSEETFDQHRKLRTRAEDYVRKPIAFGELLEHMRPFVKVENGRPASGSDDDAIIIDDEIELDGVEAAAIVEAAAEETTDVSHAGNVEAEVEAFANTAFDRLMESEPPTSTRSSRAPKAEAPVDLPERPSAPRVPSAPPAVAKKTSSAPPRPTIDAEVERLRGETEKQKAELARMERELNTARAEITRLEQAAQRGSESDERVTKLQRELDELKLKAASGGKVAGVSSREFLDLREGLNKKEKEILSLRDQITRKEKDLLDSSDTTLALERDKADLEDKITNLERDVASAKAFAETAKADKDQAAKRAEDFKTRGEKVKIELEAKTAELANIGKKHDEELAQRDQALAAHKEQAQKDAEAAAEASRAALEAAERAAEQKLQTSLEDMRQELRREREEALTKRNDEAQAEKAEALAAQQKDYEARLASLMQSHEDDQRRLNERVSELSTDLAARIEEREELLRELPKTKDKLTTAETQLAATKAELAETRDRLNQHTQRLETATAKWDQNRKTLDQAKDALAAALAQIEEVESRGLE
jgi:DNA-binding response OmpR family regulator/chromosome segregation ATPase